MQRVQRTAATEAAAWRGKQGHEGQHPEGAGGEHARRVRRSPPEGVLAGEEGAARLVVVAEGGAADAVLPLVPAPAREGGTPPWTPPIFHSPTSAVSLWLSCLVTGGGPFGGKGWAAFVESAFNVNDVQQDALPGPAQSVQAVPAEQWGCTAVQPACLSGDAKFDRHLVDGWWRAAMRGKSGGGEG